jgi:hypothetical protein
MNNLDMRTNISSINKVFSIISNHTSGNELTQAHRALTFHRK